jgi:hypothetical protein
VRKRVERDPDLCELINEDIGFFVNLNLGSKSRVSRALVPTYFTGAIFLRVEPSL